MNHLFPRILLLTSVAVTFSAADEHTVKRFPLATEESVEATLLPDGETTPLPPRPVRWTSFSIEQITDHGVAVKKGDTLIRYKTKDIDKALGELTRDLAAKTLVIDAAKRKLSDLESTLEHRLAQLTHEAEVAKNENEYFKNTRRGLDAQSADQRLERAKQYLANEKEEFEQLKKMYDADDVTEETEEIILTRQQNAVIAAEFALKLQTEKHRRTHKVLLPREAITLAHAERDAKDALEQEKRELPHGIKVKRQEITALSKELENARMALSELKEDREIFEIKAPANGWFFHGVVQNGTWTRNDLPKTLHKDSSPPATRPYATFIPESAKLDLFAELPGEDARCLIENQKGIAYFPGKEESKISVTVESVSRTPDQAGKHLVEIGTVWTAKNSPGIGTKAVVRCITYYKGDAIQVPTESIGFGPDGFNVMVKLADDKLARRAVKTGRSAGGHTEILSGIEEGQVIIVP